MTKQRFEQISKMSEDERLQLSKEEISQYYDYLASTNNTSVSIPTEVYIDAGVNVASETLNIATNVNEKLVQVSQDLAKGNVPTTTVGTVGKVAVFLTMATNIYSMVKGTFKWDLVNTVNLVSSTLACLVLLGVNIACLGAIATVLASNPFTIALAVIVILVNYVAVGEMASKLKKTYMSCFNSYRRIYKLCNWADTNELIYKNFKSVLDFAKTEILKMKNDFINSEYTTNMRRKIFVGADFNSFVLFNNVITFIQSKQELSTAKDGVYNDYIDFCSIEDYIDTHEVLKQDLARIEYFILQNDLKALKDFVISIDFLTGYFDTYKLNTNLTFAVKKDIDFVLSCISKIKSAIGEKGLSDLKSENSEFKNVRNPEELFNSIYSYLIYANAMRNSPFIVCKTLLNPEYYSSQNIYEYVSAFSEYPVYLFSNWYFYFGNIMFNDIYIEKYKTELISSFNTNKSLYDENFYKDLVSDIDSYNNFKVCIIWLKCIKEFLKNLVDYDYWKYSPYFATSFTQTGISEDGKTFYNYYLPENSYLIPEIKTVISNFLKYFKSNGYMSDKFSYLLDNFKTFTDYDLKYKVPFINLRVAHSILGDYDLGGLLGKFSSYDDDNIENLFNDRIYRYEYQSTGISGQTVTKFINYKYKSSELKSNFDTFKSMFNNVTGGLMNGSYIRSVRDDGKFAFGTSYDFDINELDYYGLSENETDFFTRILIKTRDLRYLFAYCVLIFDGRWGNNKNTDWSRRWFEICYLLAKSKKLRDLFFSGYTFETTNNNDVYIKSLWEFLKGQRQDVIFPSGNNGNFNLYTLPYDMILNSKYKTQILGLYNDFKNAYNDYRNTIEQDYKLAQQSIDTETSNFLSLLSKYPQYDSSLSYAYTGKYNVYLWNIYKMAQSLGLNNKSYLDNIEKHLIPVYKLENGFVQLETYYSPMFVLFSAKDDTDLSQSYYLINQQALNNLFDIGNEKFDEKVKEYKDLVSVTIQPEIAVIDHKQIIDDISQNIKTMYSLNKEEMIDLIGSQEDEFILIQNLLNQEILEKAINNKDVINPEIVNVAEINKSLAQDTQDKINENTRVLDKNKIIKYAMVSGLLFILLNRGK